MEEVGIVPALDAEKKYELTEETVTTPNRFARRTLYRIRALRDIPRYGIKAGDLGGYVETEKNLSQTGNAWVGGDAWVCGDAQVLDDAQVSGNARVYGNAKVFGKAEVYSRARVFGDACVSGHAQVCNYACVLGDAWIEGADTWVDGNAEIVSRTTRTPIFIGGLLWPVTISDTDMKMGCECHNFEEWANFTDDEIKRMYSENTVTFWKENKERLLGFCRYHASEG